MSDRYQIRGKLGRGGMSTVYRAYDSAMGREVALKRLLPLEETNLNEAAYGALAREATALAQFQHPNVVAIFALEEDSEGPYVVMELVEGEDLNDIMKSGALSWEDFRDIAGQCLEPLVAAGELNLLHRDIKPGNIMLTETASGRFLVKLLDFGLAKFSQQPSTQTLDQRGSFLGSIEYIAPEQLELRPLDQRTDLYSLGCVFYYMLAQESPFAGGSPAETSMNHLNHRCHPIGGIRPDIPPLVAAWIMRLMSREPGDRPDNAKAALREFQDAVTGVAFSPPRPNLETVGTEEAELGKSATPPVLASELFEEAASTRSIITASGPIPLVLPKTEETRPLRLRTGSVSPPSASASAGKVTRRRFEKKGRGCLFLIAGSVLVLLALGYLTTIASLDRPERAAHPAGSCIL